MTRVAGSTQRGRGRQSAATARYEADLASFCAAILQIDSTLDVRVSSRGWAYLLENAGTITKGELDAELHAAVNLRHGRP